MTRGSIREYAAAVRERYQAAGKCEQGRILDEFCRTTGYHRKAAIRLLNRPPTRPERRRGPPPRYGPAVAHALYQVWEAADRLCAKRLAPFLPELVAQLERHGELTLAPPVRARLLALSPATIDRLLRPLRTQGYRQPRTASRALTALQAQVPVRTWGEWAGVAPGALQADLVSHCGESTAGFYLTTLVAVDVATGWSELEAIWGKGQQRVGSGVHHLRQRLPFPLRELHTDNGGE
ncbi:MAG TPA: ISNCY family transposase, partial [Chloroflexota bacterium]|nr:ISNCY family transposase [Chloroflexota bacterium]